MKLFHDNAETKTVSLERSKRLAQMREEREMRKAEENADFDDEDDEFAEDSAAAKDKGKDEKKDDVILTEALNILADLSKLTGGNDAPDTPDASTSAFWSIFGGQQ